METNEEFNGDFYPASELRVIVPNKHIVLADQSSYKGQAAAAPDSRNLWIYVYPEAEKTMVELFPIFNDATKTNRIENWTVDELEPTVYEGYTIMKSIKAEYNGQVVICLEHE